MCDPGSPLSRVALLYTPGSVSGTGNARGNGPPASRRGNMNFTKAPIVITFKDGTEFTMDVSDFEDACASICLGGMTDEEWKGVGERLQDEYRDFTPEVVDGEADLSCVWHDYESYLLDTHSACYYDDMSEKDRDTACSDGISGEALRELVARVRG